MKTIERFSQWAEKEGIADWLQAQHAHRDVYDCFRREAVAEIKELHKRSPKYVYDEPSQSEVIAEFGVPVENVTAEHEPGADGKARPMLGGELLTPEEFAVSHFRRLGYEVLVTESRPFHALFGVFMWLLIQDPADPLVRPVTFGDRDSYEQDRQGTPVWTTLPEDFGAPGYMPRRAEAIAEHFELIPTAKEEMLWLFDYWVEPSTGLRQYLWAHRQHDVQTARRVAHVLGPKTVSAILRYLVGDYWGRYCGWPDLLIHGPNEFCFVEVKFSKDKLSEDQKDWIRGNHSYLQLPFRILKIHRQPGG